MRGFFLSSVPKRCRNELAPHLLTISGNADYFNDLGGIKDMAEGEGGGAGNFVWAVALIIIVAIIAAVIMSGGFLTRGDKDIDVDISAPAR